MIKSNPEFKVTSMLSEELEHLKEIASHDWSREYLEKGMTRTSFLFKRISDYISFEDKRVLDLGCGMGNVSILGSEYSPYIVGLDISVNQLKRTKWRLNLRRIARVHLMNGDALKLPFMDDVFDVVITYDLYEHVSDKDRLLNEIFRVINKNGFLVLTTGNRLFPLDRHTLLWFVDYLPKRLATQYVRLMNRGNSYKVSQPTYWSLQRKLRRCFRVVMIDGNSALKMLEEVYPAYLRKYRKTIPLIKVLIRIGVFKFITPKYIAVLQKPPE